MIIIDYGAGNLTSVANAFRCLKVDYIASSKPAKVDSADRIILPGVGSFGFMMAQLRIRGLEAPLKRALRRGVPFLGICLGMQALFEESEESPGAKGLGIFKGKVVRFKLGKVPQIGWNEVTPLRNDILRKGYAYFVNSYYPVPVDRDIIAAETDYNGKFASAVQSKNITAVQFHPERSGKYGLALLQRWLEC